MMRECGNEGWWTTGGRQSLSPLQLQMEWGQPQASHGHGQWPPHLTMVIVVIINIIMVLINIVMYHILS